MGDLSIGRSCWQLMVCSALDMMRLAAASDLGSPLQLGWSNASAMEASQAGWSSIGTASLMEMNASFQMSRFFLRLSAESLEGVGCLLGVSVGGGA
jgi:hypothetical protein